jgi:hypothetical protein
MPKLPMGDKGPCEIIWNYGESGALYLGDYLGQVILSEETGVSNIEVEKYGDAAVDAIFTGAVVTLEIPMTRPALAALSAVLMGDLVTSGDHQYLEIPNPAGCSLYDLARDIVIKPICNGVVDVDPANWIHLFRCHPIPGMNLVFDRSTQRTFPVKFMVFVSQESGEEGLFGTLGMPSGSTEYGL